MLTSRPPSTSPETEGGGRIAAMSEQRPERLGSFTESDVQRISDAVRRAEQSTAGEIVTYIVQECEDYRDAPWKGAVTGVLTAGAIVALLDTFAQSWGGPHPAVWFAALLVGTLFGYLVTERVPVLRRLAATDDLMVSRVQERAEAAFLEEEVFATRDRSGILVFLALFERRAVVLGDEGINAVVDATAWEKVVEVVTRGMRSGRSTEALIEAIEMCGELLSSVGLAPKSDDDNELSDDPRIRQQ